MEGREEGGKEGGREERRKGRKGGRRGKGKEGPSGGRAVEAAGQACALSRLTVQQMGPLPLCTPCVPSDRVRSL